MATHAAAGAGRARSGKLTAVWLLAGGIVCLTWGLSAPPLFTARPGEIHDFTQEWTSARNYFEGLPIYLELAESVPLYFNGSYFGPIRVNAHPPASVLMSLPLAFLDYPRAFLVWNLVTIAALAASCWLIFRAQHLGYGAWIVLPAAVLILASNTLSQHLKFGQFAAILLLLIAGAWSAEQRQAWLLSGALVGAAAAIKLAPAFLVVYFLAQRRWRAVGGLVAAFLLVNGVAVVLFGVETYRAYVQDVIPQVLVFREWWVNASFSGFWHKLLDGSSGHVRPLVQAGGAAAFITAASSLVATALVAQRCRRARTRAERDLALCACVVAMLLLSPITWDHYLVILILPFAVLWRHIPQTMGHRAAVIALILLLTTVDPRWVWDATIAGDGELADGPNFSVASPWQTLTVISYPFYALVALFGYCLAVRGSRDDARAPIAPQRGGAVVADRT